MSSSKMSGLRGRFGLAGAVLFLLLLAVWLHGMWPDSAEPLSFSDLGVPASDSGASLPIEQRLPDIDMDQWSESVAQAVHRYRQESDRRHLETLEAGFREQAQALDTWRQALGETVAGQGAGLADLDRRLAVLEQGMARLLEALEEPGEGASARPGFVFRDIEVWHGQAVALLEHEGRILPAQVGELRLGWRIQAIDRVHRTLHVSDGTTELVLEEQ